MLIAILESPYPTLNFLKFKDLFKLTLVSKQINDIVFAFRYKSLYKIDPTDYELYKIMKIPKNIYIMLNLYKTGLDHPNNPRAQKIYFDILTRYFEMFGLSKLTKHVRCSLICMAASYCSPAIVRLIIKSGAGINDCQNDCSIYGMPIMKNKLDIIETLLELNYPIKTTRNPPIRIAIQYQNVAAVKLLLKYGTNPLDAYRGETHIQYSERVGYDEITQLLKNEINA